MNRRHCGATIRWMLSIACALAFVAGSTWPRFARAENRIRIRGNYYREESTRVLAPEIQFTVDAPDERLTLGASYLLDVVSSASIATGTAEATGGDAVFTELRHQWTATAASKLRDWSLGASFLYSTETDYISRSLGLSFGRELLQRTLSLSLAYAYNFDRVFRISGGAGVRLPWCGGVYGGTCDDRPGGTNLLQTHYLALRYSHALHRRLVLFATAEYALSNGPQDNPYRGMLIPSATEERHPLQRNRFALWVGPRWAVPKSPVVLEPRYRFSVDDWGVLTHVAEGRLHVRLAQYVRMRLRYRYYRQSKSFFYEEGYVYPDFDDTLLCTRDTPEGCTTADPKLSAFRSHTPGIQLTFELDGLAERTGWEALERGTLRATYDFVAQTSRFGNARAIGSIDLSLAF